MTHFPIVALRRRLNPRQISLGRLVPVLLSALALVTASPAAWALTSTTTSLLTAPDNPNSGAVITLTAQVLATEYTVAGGTVSFTDTYNGVSEVLGTVQVQSTNGNAGTAILETEVGGVGTHQFQAIYSGTSFFATSSSPAQSVPFAIPYASATALTTTGTAPDLTPLRELYPPLVLRRRREPSPSLIPPPILFWVPRRLIPRPCRTVLRLRPTIPSPG